MSTHCSAHGFTNCVINNVYRPFFGDIVCEELYGAWKCNLCNQKGICPLIDIYNKLNEDTVDNLPA